MIDLRHENASQVCIHRSVCVSSNITVFEWSRPNKEPRDQRTRCLNPKRRAEDQNGRDTRNGQHLVTVFSDEKLFTVEAEFNSQNHRVLAKDLQKAFDKGKTVHRVSHPAKVMVFGAICSTGKCPLVFVEKDLKITKEYYVKEILEKQLLPWAQQHFNGQHWICQQDGAPPHTAKYTQDWCKAHLPAFIEKDRWPASSPDLNPIDFSIWGVLQNKVCARPHSSVEALKKTLGEEWDQLSIEYLRATVESYPRRLRAVIAAKGGRIE
uniref:DDE_3 domain-containing protein n=1 Tax=Caenorhabditis japonica TaxID=281687 RepID=A0A8R1IFH1_CAEJA